MKTTTLLLGALAALLPATLGHGQSADVALAGLSAVIAGEQAPSAVGPVLTLDEVERVALEENPGIRVAVRHVSMAESHVSTTGALEDPQFMVRNWQVPLVHPWDYNAAQNMLMIGQALPGRGKRGLETAVAQSDVEVAKDELAATQLRIHVEVRKAFYDLLRAQEEIRIHEQHVNIAQQAIAAARIKYTVGKVPQVEMLKAQVALTRLAEHMIRFERDSNVARSRLNTLLGRDPDAAIQLQGDFGLDRTLPTLSTLEAQSLQSRPDLREAEAAAAKSRKEQNLAKAGYRPDFNVAAGYMLMPSGSNPRNNYMLEGSMTLPWLNRHKHDADMSEAAAVTTEKDAELDAMRNEARGQIQEALVEAQASQRLARVYQDSLRQQAEQTLHASVIAYENDQASFLDLLDSQMTVVDADLAWIDALGEFNDRMAELDLASGGVLDEPPAADEEKKQ
jgi:cobalt-zinc-cadmium efflux system outer membrane protein